MFGLCSCGTVVEFVPDGGGNQGVYHPPVRRHPIQPQALRRFQDEDRRVFAGDQSDFGPFASMRQPAGHGVYRPDYRPRPQPPRRSYVTPINTYGMPIGSYIKPVNTGGRYDPNYRYGF